MININNEQFLQAIFGNSYIYSHVTSFIQDPNNIPNDERGLCWSGGYYKDTPLIPNSNQFYTVSLFSPDENNRSRRRKAQFSGTYVIGLDDVKEKLPIEQVMKLPPPSIVLKSSLYSEQWLYILNQPEQDRDKIDNLHDGLIANGLAPNSKDPGQKGVTRFLRLPEGCNTKAKRVSENGGTPPGCEITEWHPERRYMLEQLAEPFGVDLNIVRADKRIDGAAAIDDHPILHTDAIEIKSKISDGRFSIVCPWVDEHTDRDDSGSAIFTNDDGSIGYRCHHGNCDGRTANDLLKFIETKQHDFSSVLKNWQILREFKTVSEPNFLVPATAEPVSFMQPVTPEAPVSSPAQVDNFMFATGSINPLNLEGDERRFIVTEQPINAIQLMCDELRRINHRSPEAREMAANVLKYTDDLPKLEKMQWHTEVCDLMGWGKGDFKEILKDLRLQWYGERVTAAEFYDNVIYVKELNQFYDWNCRIFFTTDAFQNSFSHIDEDARKNALQGGRVKKVDRLDYAPKQQRTFTEKGVTYGNTWSDVSQSNGTSGDVSRWRDHFAVLGWGEHLKHIEQWMSYTLRHPDKKINHMLLLGSGEGCGKDFILYPLTKAMGDNYTVISGEELLRDFDDHLLSTKYIHVNETELGDRREAMAVSNKLKPLAAAPPDTLRVNQKGIKPIKIRNILNATMTTNSLLPVRLNGPSRRFYGTWSDLNPRDEHDNMKPEWLEYWEDRWNWMKADGWKNVAYHLMYMVDLSDFNPGEAPPMTDFLRDIKEASKSPAQQTIESFVKKKLGVFSSDLVTASDMSDTLRLGGGFAVNVMYTDGKYFTPTKVGIIMKEIGHHIQLKAYYLGSRVNLWVLRNNIKYQSMDSTALYHEYERQMKEARGAAMMQVVK